MSQKTILHNRITTVRFLEKDTILCVGRQLLSIGFVYVGSFNFGNEVLIKEQLANVRNVTAAVRSIFKDGAIEMGEDVNVRGTADVMTREKSFEVCDAEVVGRLKAAQKGVIQV